MQSLRQVYVGGALTFTRTIHVRTAEDRQEVGVTCEAVVGKLHRAHALRLATKLILGIRDEIDAVEKNLGREAARVEARVVLAVVAVVFVRNGTELVGSAVADQSHEILEVVAVRYEVLGEVAEESRMSGGISDAQVVFRID